jgi:O-antigen/teichoic acid export membrane protein
MPGSLKFSLGLNFAGRFWAGAVAFLATPVYLHWLGRESFGLVGFCLLLQAILGFVSAGLADAANRETAAAAQNGTAAVAAQQLAFMRLAWLVGLGLGGVVAGLSGMLARHWLTLDQVGADSAQRAIQLMAALMALQIPIDLYVGVFLGARRHLAANLAMAGGATLRAVVTVAALAFVEPTIKAFFLAQIAASLLTAAACHVALRRGAPGEARPTWQTTWSKLRASFQFSAGMTAIAFTSMLLGQADRIVLSRILRLDEFGVYSIAVTLANLLYFLISPVQAVYYPELSRCIVQKQREPLTELYHQACQFMAVLVFPTGLIMAFFSRDVLGWWTFSATVAAEAAPVVAVLVAVRMIGGLNTMPYALQFAHGWISLVLGSNTAAIVVLLPVLCYLALQWGAMGAALGYLLIGLPFLGWIVWRMHRRMLPGELSRWIWRDTMPSFAVALVVAGAGKFFEPSGLAPAGRFLWVALASAISLGAVVLANAFMRSQLRKLGGQIGLFGRHLWT